MSSGIRERHIGQLPYTKEKRKEARFVRFLHTILCEACFEKTKTETAHYFSRRGGYSDRAHNRYPQKCNERLKVDRRVEYALYYDGRGKRRRLLHAF